MSKQPRGELISKHIIPDHPLVVLPSLAAAIGLNEAIALQQVYYLIGKFEGKTIDGKRWIHLTDKEWSEQFPFWARNTIRRILKKLESDSYISTAHLSNNPLDRTTWYSVNQDAAIKVSREPVKPKRKRRADYPNFGQSMKARRRSKVRTIDDAQSRESKVRTIDDPKLGQSLISETSSSEIGSGSETPSLATPKSGSQASDPLGAEVDALTPSKELEAFKEKQAYAHLQTSPEKPPPVEKGALYLQTESGAHEGPYAPTGKNNPAGAYTQGAALPADAKVIPRPAAAPLKPRLRNAVFDAIALGSFNTTKAVGDGGRIGKVAAGVRVCQEDGLTDAELAANLTAMYAWYKTQHPQLSAPASVETICKYLNEYRTGGERPSVGTPRPVDYLANDYFKRHETDGPPDASTEGQDPVALAIYNLRGAHSRAVDAWTFAKNELYVVLNRATYNTWVKDLELVQVEIADEQDTFTVVTPNKQVKDYCAAHVGAALEKSIEGLYRQSVRIEFVTEAEFAAA